MEKRTVNIDGRTIPYTVRRSGRARSMRLNVTPFDGVVVVLPKRLKMWVNTDQFLKENRVWLLKHLKIAGLELSGEDALLGDKITPGSSIPYLGREWVVEVHPEERGARGTITLQADDELLTIDNVQGVMLRDPAYLTAFFSRWLRNEAKQKISEVVVEEAGRLDVSYEDVRVRTLKSKWGSCNSNGVLTFNWRLVLFPEGILRYIVIHELCHLVHFDHSPEFWNLVERQHPEYRRSVSWLKSEGINARNLLVGL